MRAAVKWPEDQASGYRVTRLEFHIWELSGGPCRSSSRSPKRLWRTAMARFVLLGGPDCDNVMNFLLFWREIVQKYFDGVRPLRERHFT